jgi:hypothetical protein
MTKRVKSGLTRGAGNGFTAELVRHRQTKETEQIGCTYGIPRQSSTLHLSQKRWQEPFSILCGGSGAGPEKF